MQVTALDLSLSATGVAHNAGTAERAFTLRPPRLRGVERLEWIMRRIVKETHAKDLVVIENYAFARPNQAHQIGELGGVIRLALYTRKIQYVEIAPSALKKYATGKGNAPKEAVLSAAFQRLSYSGYDHNESDALWLLAMALDHYGLDGAAQVPKVNREALAKVGWPARELLEVAA